MFENEVNPDKITKADLVVCIPSYKEADSIAFPVEKASEGLVKYFPDHRSVIINCDNDSPDGTKGAFLNTPTQVPKIYLSTPAGVKGKGNNFRNLFQKVVDLEAQAVVVVDADLKSVTPEWIKRLGEPLFTDYTYVAPLYVRHKYDGTITNGIAYPLSRALYGRRVRQPIGGDFGFSGELGKGGTGENDDRTLHRFRYSAHRPKSVVDDRASVQHGTARPEAFFHAPLGVLKFQVAGIGIRRRRQ